MEITYCTEHLNINEAIGKQTYSERFWKIVNPPRKKNSMKGSLGKGIYFETDNPLDPDNDNANTTFYKSIMFLRDKKLTKYEAFKKANIDDYPKFIYFY